MHNWLAVPPLVPPDTRILRDCGVFFLHYFSDTRKKRDYGLFKAISKPLRHTLSERTAPVQMVSSARVLYNGVVGHEVTGEHEVDPENLGEG